MRVKTEEKRNAILKVAADIFETQGFEAASMAQIAAKVGGSKGTLYGYFASKEELFLHVMMNIAQSHKRNLQDYTYQKGDIGKALTEFGNIYLQFLTQGWLVDMYRTVVGFKNDSNLLSNFYETGPQKGLTRIAGFMQQAIDEGQLQHADTMLMAKQFRALLEAEVMQPLILKAIPQPTPTEIEAIVHRACTSFLKIYSAN